MRTHQQPTVRRTTAVFVAGLLIGLLGIGLAACGYSSASMGSTLSQTQVQSQAQIQVQTKVRNCGTVQGFGHLEVPVIDPGAAAVESCFLQAFRACQPAKLVYIVGGVDTVLLRTFIIHNKHGKCSITDARQFRVVPRALSPAQVFACAGLTNLSKGMRIDACGKDGTVVVPGV